jgi:ATP-dependent Clp protease ATP-binding subunit ClpA
MIRYERLLELARLERELVAEGRWDEIAELAAEREALVLTLPESAPAEAQPALEEALRVVSQTSDAIGAVLEELRRELAGLRVHRRVASSYAASAPSGSLDTSA